jgi:branched-chain amino acid transport system ATP-binding protein
MRARMEPLLRHLPMLKVNNIEVVYSDVILVLRGVSLEVGKGQIVSLLGANGAGKSTTLKAISGLLHAQQGEVTRGNIEFDGVRIDKLEPDEIVRLGIVQVLEGRPLFRHLTTEENLLTGALFRSPGSAVLRQEMDQVYHYFPRLAELRKRTSGYLSGGEQQMVVIGRALMARPRLMLLDEPSLGLAPLLVREIFEIIRQINAESGVSILLVEQNANVALRTSRYAYVMETGRVVLDGPATELAENADIKEFYLGLTQLGERKSYREVKHYKRRKRWLG